jgi:hypothetical protein
LMSLSYCSSRDLATDTADGRQINICVVSQD